MGETIDTILNLPSKYDQLAQALVKLIFDSTIFKVQ